MKEYINQIYSEGLATIFYLKPIKYIDKKVKNNKLKIVVKKVIKIIYTLFVVLLAGYIFYKRFPFK